MTAETTTEFFARKAHEAREAEAKRAAFTAAVEAEYARMKAAGAMKRGGMTYAECYRTAYDKVMMEFAGA